MLAISVMSVAGCGGSPRSSGSSESTQLSASGTISTPSATSDIDPAGTSPTSVGTLLEIVRDGGLCADGQVCHEEITVSTNGDWTRIPGPAFGSISLVDRDQLTRLIDAETNGAPTITTTPETSCPSAHDGQDLTYIFHSGQRSTKASNCNADFSQSNPLLHLVADIVEQIDGS